jgi:hypothetical protein
VSVRVRKVELVLKGEGNMRRIEREQEKGSKRAKRVDATHGQRELGPPSS